MPLIFEIGDVLDAQTDALLLTVDGVARNKPDPARPIRGGKEILGGNLANQFARRWPEDWEDMQREITFPVPIGRSVGIPWDGDCPWRLIVLASTLHHVGERTNAEKIAIIRGAWTEALAIAVRHNTYSLATTALKGGWRLPLADAVDAMFSTYRQASPAAQRVTLVLRALSQDELDVFTEVAGHYGLLAA
jgi:hypothetical protein